MQTIIDYCGCQLQSHKSQKQWNGFLIQIKFVQPHREEKDFSITILTSGILSFIMNYP